MNELENARLYVKQNATAIVSFTVAVLGAMIPIWLGALFLIGYGKWQGWSFFWQGGEFYIYSAAFSTQALYLLLNYIITSSDKKNPKVLALFALSAIVMFVSGALYGSTITSEIISGQNFNPGFLTITSIILLALSLFFVYGAEVFNAKSPDVVSEVTDDIEEMKASI